MMFGGGPSLGGSLDYPQSFYNKDEQRNDLGMAFDGEQKLLITIGKIENITIILFYKEALLAISLGKPRVKIWSVGKNKNLKQMTQITMMQN